MFIFNKKITYTCLKWIMLNIVPSYFYQFIPKILPNKTLFLKKDLQLSSHLLCKIFFSKMELIYLACLLMVILLFKKNWVQSNVEYGEWHLYASWNLTLFSVLSHHHSFCLVLNFIFSCHLIFPPHFSSPCLGLSCGT